MAPGCSSDGGGDDGAGGAAATGCSGIDYASFKGGAVPSFKTDIMPIFGLSCTASDCHNAKDKKAGLELGWRCRYNTATKVCEFPAVLDPNDTSSNPPKPLTQDVIDAAHASLMAPAKTVTGSGVPRVIPGDPERSFVIEKMADTQATKNYVCTNQDPSHTTNPQPCGALMPLGGEPLCAGTGMERFKTLARWIANGAPNN